MPIPDVQMPNQELHANFEDEAKEQPAYFGSAIFTLPGGEKVLASQASGIISMQMVGGHGTSIGLMLFGNGGGSYYTLSPDDTRRMAQSLIELADEIDDGLAGGVS